MRTPLIRLSIAFAVALSTATLAAAQTPDGDETITLSLGDIFEILPSTDLQNPEFSWILTQDRTFIQAERKELFRYRFIEPKTYTLIGSIQAGDQSAVIQRTFTIKVIPRSQSGSTSVASIASGTAATLVTTFPPTNPQGKAVIAEGTQTLRIMPKNQETKPLALDTDLSRDTDGNGSPLNDLDNGESFFHSDATPMYVWFTSLRESQDISITAPSGQSGTAQQKISVLTEEYAKMQGLFVSPIAITVAPVSSSEFDFTANVDASVSSTSLLYTWDFGDGEESLLTNPRHAFGTTGTFTVSLRVRDLETGNEIGSVETDVEVLSLSDGTESSAAASSVSSETGGEASGPGLLSMLSGWVSYIVLLVISLLIGTVGVILFGRMRKKTSISDTFASMEAKIIDQPATAKNPPPLEIKKPVTATITVAKPDVSAPPIQAATTKPVVPQPPKAPVAPTTPKPAAPVAPQTPPAQPVVDTDNAPAWLKKGMATQTPAAPAQPKPAAPSAPQPPKAPTPQTPKPPVTPPAPKPATPAVPQPPKPQAPAAPTVPAPTVPVTPKPAPQPPVTPKPPVPPTPAVAQAPVAPQAAVAPVPTPTPAVTPAPAPVPVAPTVPTPPAAPAPVAPATLPTTPAPAPQPIPPATPQEKPLTEGRDEPIAFIRAESLTPPPSQNPSQSA